MSPCTKHLCAGLGVSLLVHHLRAPWPTNEREKETYLVMGGRRTDRPKALSLLLDSVDNAGQQIEAHAGNLLGILARHAPEQASDINQLGMVESS